MTVGAGVTRAPTFGERLRQLRTDAGLTQEELAERAGLTVYGIGALERGNRTNPYPHTVRALAAALELDDEQRRALLASLPRRRRGGSPAAAPPPEAAGPADDGAPQTTLHGREDDLARTVEVLRAHRLVTLTGPGGVGKTRLATELVRRLAPDHVDGAVVVPLAHVRKAADVVPAIARAVDLQEAETIGTPADLGRALAERQLLLVLDNLEQVADVGPAVASVVESAPGIRVLATSRTSLRVRGESVHPLEPLAIPDEEPTNLAELAVRPSGAMLLERVSAAAPALELRDADAGPLAEVCRRVAGLPLALELVASPLGSLGPAGLLSRFDEVMQRGVITDLPERQRTLRAALEWSRELLAADEVRLLARMSVFPGGVTLDAAEAVGGLDRTWEALDHLVHHSLLRADRQPDGQVRYRMLAPVAEWALGLLSDREQYDARRRLANWVLELAESAAPEYTRDQQITWLARLDAEDANLTAALDWLLDEGDDPEAAARIGWALWLYWWLRGGLRVGRDTMTRVLTRPLAPEVEAGARLTYAAMTFARGELDESAPAWQRALELGLEHDDWAAATSAAAGAGLVVLQRGDLDAAEASMQQALDYSRRDPGWVGDWVAGLAEVWLGTVDRARGDVASARAHLDRGLAGATGRGDRLTAYIALFNLAQLDLSVGDPDAARSRLEHAVRLTLETRDAANLAAVAEAMAVVLAARRTYGQVPQLMGAAESMRESAGGRVYGYYLPDVDAQREAVAGAREELGDDEYDDRLDRGRGLDFDAAADVVLEA